ncbi:phospholipid-translocating P-type ATPase domain-containing protein [Aspergillus aculeatinus CBS 121060]|uniref:Phospholipid-translocating P-type ATPase domain-containing protein n=1 Tax=Aspergillus aculeatinus CBS 121060 TaxID=1448322 RepID=A0ACD1GZY1_9EURO|nr:phospholipid-translocating P-type ATPase domain-containing protein [Aspergillus aculeatinus CBS 121060]RAH66774.1 phospholipid-translocating P-type ATPase domain-containing protein [Aspergillus aculeatinus CBS 121060]
MASVDLGTDGVEPDNEARETNSNVSKPTKRQRWATQRVAGSGGARKRVSIIDRLHKRPNVEEEKQQPAAVDPPPPLPQSPVNSTAPSNRTIYFNIPIPENERDEDGRPKMEYPRNKIRTAKYTPLSFVPKNLWFQFQNIANIYFLFIIILGFFSIFGVASPAVNTVPLIVIVVLTSLKDAIEDFRRTILDNELNNSPVYRLIDWTNVNSTEDQISMWRRFKKACTRATVTTYRATKALFQQKNTPQPAKDNRRATFMSTISPRASFASQREDDAIQMTSVQNFTPDARPDWPLPAADVDYRSMPDKAAGFQAVERNASATSPRKVGSIVDMSKQTLGKARFKRDFWKNIQVGDYVRLYNGDQVPADIILLSTSDPDGACYVETKSLDGETNLKVRQALHCGRQVRHARDCEKAEFVIDSEAPHPNLYAYNGALRWDQRDPDYPDAPRREMVEPVTINNLLLRGCSLRNTEWALGVVLFTGEETKVMLNSGVTPSKRPRLAKDLNWNVIYNFVILFVMCLICGIANGAAWGSSHRSLDYFDFGSYGSTPAVTGFITFWVALILFQNLVPISLYISLEIVRTIQAVFIHSDVFMYYDKLGISCIPKSWNISDDVGQIEYIFSDKTGTLTQNVMDFKKCTINGVSYGEAFTEAQVGIVRREGGDADAMAANARKKLAADTVRMVGMLRKMYDNPYLRDESLTFISPDFVADLDGHSGEAQRKATEHFMLTLAVCHTVITEQTPGDPPQIEFQAQSPDEAALVGTARDCGFTVLGRSNDDLIVNVLGEERTYTVLNTLEFNSTRKRMSAIIRMPDGSIRLFCKGADSIIYSRLAPGKQQELRKQTAQHLEMFASEGLRTLCVADRELSEEEYLAWSKEHDLAAAALTDREEKLEEVASNIEQDLMLIGGTAIEDRLQDGVPDTISLLAEAGIKLWVLTGDKVETAINIGFSCNLLDNDMELIVFNIPSDQPQRASQELDKQLERFGMTGSDEELILARGDHRPPAPTHAVVIDGETLKLMLDEELKQRFLLLCKQCKSVLCCRVSPAQKAAVVRMVKNGLDIMALSIGDGANDVAMIQEADVGVGIIGEEGRQAAMSSDYAIGQFRFLQRLVLVHGRYSYRRMAETIANFFYKNLVWTLALFWYSIYNDYDGSYLFDYTYIVLVNVAFTSLPVILMGIFDQDVDDKVSLAVPQLYMRGIERKEWSQLKFWLYMADGLYQSIICFFMPYLLYSPATFVHHNGLNINDRTRMGVLVGTSAVFASNGYILMNSYRWDWLTVMINGISSLLIFLWTGIYSSLEASTTFFHAGLEVYSALSFWVVLLLTVMICLLPRFAVKSFQKVFFPLDVDIIREQVSQGKFKFLDQYEAYVPPRAAEKAAAARALGDESSTSSDFVKPIQPTVKHDPFSDEQQIFSPSYPPTIRTHKSHSKNGSSGTTYASSLDTTRLPHPQPVDYVHYSSERTRHSFDRVPPTFEVDQDFQQPELLTRESSYPRVQEPDSPLKGPHDPPLHAI